MSDVTKLPKWAQDKIRLLEMRLGELQTKYDVLAGEGIQQPSEAGIYWSVLLDPYRSLPTRSVRFISKENGAVDVTLRDNGNVINVNGLSGSVVIKPNSSNSFDVGRER